MYYFINEYILQKNSSVEHTAIDRVKLFNRYQTPAKIVTKMYDRLLHRTIDDFGVKSDEVLNMFDFFQGTATVPTKVMHTEDLHLPTEYAVQVGANFSVISNGDDTIENVGFIPGTIGRVFYQEYVDNQGNLLSTDLWDWRGFKSSTQYFGQNGKLVLERYYNLAGETVMEQYFVPDTNGNPLASRIILKNYDGVAERFFQNTDALFGFFIHELSRLGNGEATFISDRPGTGVQPLLHLDAPAHKYVLVPIYHTRDINDPLHAQLDAFLQPAFDNVARFDGFITSTAAQAAHIKARFPQANVLTMPAVTTAPTSQSKLKPITERPKQLLYVGRLAVDRQIDQLIRVAALVKAKKSDVQLDIYGYGDPEYVKTLTKLIEELKLQGNVHLMDYHADIEDRYDDYQILLNTALADGGPMAIPEAMSHGIPTVSYRFNYGPADMINDGVDGFLIDQGNQLAMSDRVISLLSDATQLTTVSEAAFKQMHENQTHLKVWHQWQRALNMKEA